MKNAHTHHFVVVQIFFMRPSASRRPPWPCYEYIIIQFANHRANMRKKMCGNAFACERRCVSLWIGLSLKVPSYFVHNFSQFSVFSHAMQWMTKAKHLLCGILPVSLPGILCDIVLRKWLRSEIYRRRKAFRQMEALGRVVRIGN